VIMPNQIRNGDKVPLNIWLDKPPCRICRANCFITFTPLHLKPVMISGYQSCKETSSGKPDIICSVANVTKEHVFGLELMQPPITKQTGILTTKVSCSSSQEATDDSITTVSNIISSVRLTISLSSSTTSTSNPQSVPNDLTVSNIGDTTAHQVVCKITGPNKENVKDLLFGDIFGLSSGTLNFNVNMQTNQVGTVKVNCMAANHANTISTSWNITIVSTTPSPPVKPTDHSSSSDPTKKPSTGPSEKPTEKPSPVSSEKPTEKPSPVSSEKPTTPQPSKPDEDGEGSSTMIIIFIVGLVVILGVAVGSCLYFGYNPIRAVQHPTPEAGDMNRFSALSKEFETEMQPQKIVKD